jgi:peptidyl-tRNA hydrolase
MYAVVRRDLEMPPGKLSAQSGHAYTASLFDCIDKKPDDARRYRRFDNGGSKVTLFAKGEAELMALEARCREAGIPHALFTDSGHVLPPHFDGGEVVTALGIGPVRRADAKPILKKLRCV